MTQTAEPIIRIAAKGDGITASGRFAWGAAPGDLLLADGTLEPGPHRAVPPCRHFGRCGGCQLQQLDEQTLTEFVGARVANASASQELGPERITLPHLSPPGSFLQATADGEHALTAAVCEWLAGAASVADLFAGLGTFAFALAAQGSKVLAVEAARDAHQACKSASGRAQLPIHSLHRDLFRNPLMPEELERFAGVVLDPPRAGARDQIERIAASTVPRVVYLSCNPSSWAKDAKTLIEAGYRLVELRPIGQFRWSTHVELASLFVR